MKSKAAHTARTQKGLGDYYGSGVKAPLGKIISGTGMNPVPKNKLKKTPKSLA